MSGRCRQQETHALRNLFDHSVGAVEQRFRDFNPESLGGLHDCTAIPEGDGELMRFQARCKPVRIKKTRQGNIAITNWKNPAA
jgi:hypothetical protein